MSFFKKISFLFIFLISVSVGIDFQTVHGAESPHDVPNTVKKNWNKTLGGKQYDMITGRQIVYDIYSNKYTKGGYKIVNKNFGKGTQAHLNFQGWSILFGHKRHTATNHETYIVAQEVGGNRKEYVYNTLPKGNLSATKELEYNTQGPTGVWNECPASATNKNNFKDCNMRYDNVGFDAYIPLNDLFPEPENPSKWRLFIVKKLGAQMVYTPLILPFEFNKQPFKDGLIDLSSGVDARNLLMTADPVIRRTSPRQTGVSGSTLGYFEKYKTYKTIDEDEKGTAVWYGVKDSGSTRWAASPYWDFGGEQAIINYIPPPEHVSNVIFNQDYQEGNNYWIQPGKSIGIRMRGLSRGSTMERTFLNLSGSSQNFRVRHLWNSSNKTNFDVYNTSKHIDMKSVSRSYESASKMTRQVTFNVIPKTHGHTYDVRYLYRNQENLYSNNNTFKSTGVKIKTDGNAPVHKVSNVTGSKYKDESDYWIQPNDSVDITFTQNDAHSGNKFQYLRLSEGKSIIARSRHDFNASANTNNKQLESNDVSIDSAKRTKNTADGTVEWKITGKKHGHQYNIERAYHDNVKNSTGYVEEGRLGVDGKAPIHKFEKITGAKYVNGTDYWIQPNDSVNITLTQNDEHSGNKHQYLRMMKGKDVVVESRHDFGKAENNNNKQVTNEQLTIDSVERTESSASGTVKWKVSGKKHGEVYDIERLYIDNVNNKTDYISNGRLAIDGKAPEIQYRDKDDKKDFTSRDFDTTEITVKLKFKDDDSGYKRSRYAWTQSKNLPTNAEWSDWSNTPSYNVKQAKSGTWYLHVQAEDNVGNTTTTYKGSYKINQPPMVDFTYSPNKLYEGDTVTLKATPVDPDDDLMTVELEEQVDGVWERLKYQTHVKTGDIIIHNMKVKHRDYKIRVVVKDPNEGVAKKMISFKPGELKIVGTVKHTEEWEKIHDEMGHEPDQFYAGEKFLTEAVVTDHPIESVTVTFEGEQITGSSLRIKEDMRMSGNHSLYKATVYDQIMGSKDERLKNGMAYFLFTAEWANGTKKNYLTSVNIFDNILNSHRLHRTN